MSHIWEGEGWRSFSYWNNSTCILPQLLKVYESLHLSLRPIGTLKRQNELELALEETNTWHRWSQNIHQKDCFSWKIYQQTLHDKYRIENYMSKNRDCQTYHLLLFLCHVFLKEFTIGSEPIKRHLAKVEFSSEWKEGASNSRVITNGFFFLNKKKRRKKSYSGKELGSSMWIDNMMMQL